MHSLYTNPGKSMHAYIKTIETIGFLADEVLPIGFARRNKRKKSNTNGADIHPPNLLTP